MTTPDDDPRVDLPPALPPVPRALDPLLLVVAGVVTGVVLVTMRQPQPGLFVVSGSLAVGAILRLVLRPRVAGLLVVRNRRIDVVVLASLAVALGVVAAVTHLPAG